jgi:hypothetical protein
MNINDEVRAQVDAILKDEPNKNTQAELLKSIRADIEREEIIQNFIDSAPGAFCVSQITQYRNEQLSYIQDCEIMVAMGRLNRYGNKRGWYIPINLDMKEMDFINADDEPSNVWLPFGLDEKVELYQNSVVIIAGAPNAGKTTFLLNIIKENMSRFNVNYFNSEMSAGELKVRLNKFDYIDLSQWDFKAYERAGNFQDVIKPGPENLNIIDFLEVHDEFYAMGKKIKDIHDALNGSVAVIAIQKNPGTDVGLGGFRSLEVTRLALAIDFGRLKIVKAKNFSGEDNPNGLVMNFKMLHGSQLIRTQNWHKDQRKEG